METTPEPTKKRKIESDLDLIELSLTDGRNQNFAYWSENSADEREFLESINEMSVSDLKALCSERNVKIFGATEKPELIKQLKDEILRQKQQGIEN